MTPVAHLGEYKPILSTFTQNRIRFKLMLKSPENAFKTACRAIFHLLLVVPRLNS